MTFLAPGFFFASLAVAAATVALHLIVTRQPRAGILPTARFVPDLPAAATARARRPSDLLLLLLRVLLVLAVGAGFAKPVIVPSRSATARVILVDLSRAVSNVQELRDSARSLYRENDAVILYDSEARPVGERVSDSLMALTPSSREGNLSAALIAAMRAGSALRESADSLELVIVSPLVAEQLDAATKAIRELWPGKARLVRVASHPRAERLEQRVPEIRMTPADPLAVTISLMRGGASVSALILRNAASPDSISEGRPVVFWPSLLRPKGATPRASRDSIGGVISGDAIVIASFERRWMYPADSIRGARVIARWIDGEPAAIEWGAGRECVRSVSIPVAAAGDLVIRRGFIELVSTLSRECASNIVSAPMSGADIAMITGTGGLAPREGFQARADMRSSLAPWLLGAAIALALAELLVRRRSPATVAAERGTAARIAA